MLSVAVVSRGRPALLARALTALDQQRDVEIEVVLVADATGIEAARPWAGRVKAQTFEEANISAARNRAASLAAAPVVAFLDDDAVPEPTWAARLGAPFADPSVSAAGGTVLGRNGITRQWPLRAVGPDGASREIDAPGETTLMAGTAERAIRTEGANMAVRRSVLSGLGGFDPAFRFYLDETELNLRLGAAGHVTAWVPGAVVHHGSAPSATRAPDRAPRSLVQIAASTAALSRRHGGDGAAMRAAMRAEQRGRLARHLVAGRIEPRDMARMLRELEEGWEEGLSRPLGGLGPLPEPPPPVPFGPRVTGTPAFLWGRNEAELARRARARLASGAPSTVLALSRGPRRHRVRFEDGIWIQSGGVGGRSDRTRRPASASFEGRAAEERARVADVRALPPLGRDAAPDEV